MLKITKPKANSIQVTLKVEGKIVSDWVSLLEKECLSQMQEKQVLLDLSDVTYVDHRGVEMLQRLVASGVMVGSRSVFLNLLLKT